MVSQLNNLLSSLQSKYESHHEMTKEAFISTLTMSGDTDFQKNFSFASDGWFI